MTLSKAIRQQIAEQSERRRQRFLREELEWVRAGVKARTTKSRHRLDQFYAIQGLEAPPEEREMDLLLPPPPTLGNIAIDLEEVGAAVGEGDQRRWLFRNLTVSLKPGQCTGIVGRNGVGKTTLLQICLGNRKPDAGQAIVGKRCQFNYIDQSRLILDGSGSVLDEISEGRETVEFGDQTLGARAYLRRYLFSDQRIKERVDVLSGGERARLLLAKVLKTGGNVLVLDEPTNDLDLPSLRMLEEALADFDGTVLVVSHDRYFLDRICDQIIAFEEGEVVVQTGNYSYYLEKKLQRESHYRRLEQSYKKTQSTPEKKKSEGRQRKLTYNETRELENMEEAILEAEEKVAEIEGKLNDPNFFVEHYEESVQLGEQLEPARAEVARLYDRWEELEAIRKESEGGSN